MLTLLTETMLTSWKFHWVSYSLWGRVGYPKRWLY